ncbi:MAG: response regulator [Candidatus Hydrogenedentota bacterium]
MSKILLVDDDVDLAELLRTKLVSEGHDVVVTNTGEGAFELAKKTKPEITLLDIMLPGVTGYQICRKIRIDPELYKTGVILLTALGEEPEVLHGLDQGADDYITKPFKLEKLVEKLAALSGVLESVHRVNTLTGLPGTDAVKREVNHRLARGTQIAVCYVDVANFKAYAAAKGQESGGRALQFIAQMITGLIKNMGIYESFAAHMGSEHFVVLMNFEDHERFCSSLCTQFDHSIKKVYTPEEVTRGNISAVDRRGNTGEYPLMALSIGVAHNSQRTFKSANKMFDVLAQVRQKAKPSSASVVFVDRRTTER